MIINNVNAVFVKIMIMNVDTYVFRVEKLLIIQVNMLKLDLITFFFTL